MTPLVSCILTCSSTQRVGLARKAVNNFIKQYYLPYELLVVNSTGQPILTNTQLQTEPARKTGCKIVEIPAQAGLNASAMRNTGLAVAQGDWVICVDDDDYFHPTRLMYQMAHRQENRPCLLQYQLRVDISKVLAYSKESVPMQPELHLLKKSAGISSTALFPRLDTSGNPWIFNTELNTGEYDEFISNMIRHDCEPIVCNNANHSLIPDQNLPLLSVAVYHGLNELQSQQFFETTEVKPDDLEGLTQHDIELLKKILQSYDFQIS